MQVQNTPLLSIQNASKHYAGVHALKSASLTLDAGEIHALMGENGAGKSTLIKILAGVVMPDSIDIALNGRSIQISSATDAFTYGFRFIHQELNVVPHLSVAENLFLGQTYPKWLGMLVDWRSLNRSATEVLARLGIEHINPKQKIARLNPGDQMLVKIASTLLEPEATGKSPHTHSPAKLYVMDEPTAALTGDESERLFQVMVEVKAAGCTILYISHRMDEVLRICDRVTVMRDGKTVATKIIAPKSVVTETADTNPKADRPIDVKAATKKVTANRSATDVNKREIIQLMTGRDMAQVYPPSQRPISEGANLATVCIDVRKLASGNLQDISFQVHEGEILGVAGLAGSGTSDLLRALMGVDHQHMRDVWLEGKAQGRIDPTWAWSNGLAYVPEERRSQGLVLSRSIRDNVTMPHLDTLSRGGLFLNRRKEAIQTAEVSQQVRLKAASQKQPAYQLSGGNQQKVIFARALANSPKLLLLDEPTRGVDVGAKYDIYSLIRTMSANGTAIVMASSDLSELLGMCDRILIMVEHQLVAIVQADGLTQEDLLSLCYGTHL
ncbi:MAG: sugar ABC transporter ATP-binding protein [Chloroflexota bacterium]